MDREQSCGFAEGSAMKRESRTSCKIFAPATSLRRRIGYSLAIVRLILAPVILLAVYYLFAMGRIVDRIVNIDARAAALTEQVSNEILEARRAERNYFLLHDPGNLQTNQEALASVTENLNAIGDLEPEEKPAIQKGLDAASLYRQQFASAMSAIAQPGQTAVERIQDVVKSYERGLDGFLKSSQKESRTKLIDELRSRIGSFDAQIAETVQTSNPDLRNSTNGLQISSEQILQLAAALRERNWRHVQADHQGARLLIRRAEWVLTIVSAFTILLSVWISFVLPRQAVEPLVRLRDAIDHAASGNYDIEFELQGAGEVVDIARSLQNLTAVLRRSTSSV
jgi:CHASE3 domain sensor protein